MLTLVFFMLSWFSCNSQDGVFFTDSKDDKYYDSGLAFVSSPSSLKHVNEDKLPVSSSIFYEGKNSLELTWNSVENGNWNAFVIGPEFIFQDISEKDTLLFFAYSRDSVSPVDLPYVFFEGDPNFSKSVKYDLSQSLPTGIAAREWIAVKLPMQYFFDSGMVDFTKTKAVIFGQKNADNKEHTLYIDFVAAIAGEISSEPQKPTSIEGYGFERHVELRWNQVSDYSVVEVFQYSNLDQAFKKITETNDSIFIDFFGEEDMNQSFRYKLRRRSLEGAFSDFSEEIEVAARNMNDGEFLSMVQEYTFRYFWDFAHPVSGLAYERNSSVKNEIVTSGGSGFGIMSIPVAIERNFISREDGVKRLLKILNFLKEADRFHGAWSHWLNGSTGEAIAFGTEKDRGGDLVETSFLIQGLLTAQAYFDADNEGERVIRDLVTELWLGVEWSWYQQAPDRDHLTWHWSPDYGWELDHALHGWNEVLITYLLAVSSPTHPIEPSLYHTGWARNGDIVNGRTKFGITLPLGVSNGGPLFFTHYSFLGLDPSEFGDNYVDNYYEQNRSQTLINRSYCISNPGNFVGYSEDCWGLTASDDPFGYLAHEPDLARDNGTISPTAAISSIPYTPEESMAALKHFYRDHGAQLFGPMGFYDAFNQTEEWIAPSYLAIDQGPIVLMIENFRTGLLWRLFMSNEDVKRGIGLIETPLSAPWLNDSRPTIYPNPGESGEISMRVNGSVEILGLFSTDGRKVNIEMVEKKGSSLTTREYWIKMAKTTSGSYVLRYQLDGTTYSQKILIK